jgi:phenylacetate-CoA ligase
LQADVLCCTPSYALNIAETMRERGIERSSLALQTGVFGAEPWTVGMREEIERALGLKALDIYGLSEVMGPGVSMESAEDRDGLFIWEDHFYPEVIDPVSGDVLPYGDEGELVFTSLTKRAFPVLRYRTGDICALFAVPNRSGRTMVRMTKVKGRTDDMLIVRGVNVFPSEIERVVLEQRELAPHYQILLSREGALDQLVVHAELDVIVWESLGATVDCDAARRLAGRLRDELATVLALSADVVLRPPGAIPRSEGKAVRVVDRR